MANYIDKEIICEAYVHLDVDESMTDAQIEKFKIQLKAFFDARVKFLLGEDVLTQIETADGSLKVKLTAFAGIAALLGTAVLKYPDFRNSVKAIYEDSRMLAEATNLETVFVTRTPSCDRLHSEARTGIIGRTAKLVSGLETLKSKVEGLKAPTTRADVRELDLVASAVSKFDEESRRLLEKVNSDADRFCLARGLFEAAKQFPEILPAEVEFKNTPLKQAILKENNQHLLVESAFQRYTASVKTYKSYLKMIGVASQPKKT